jgi:OHCU decarboxylase
MAGSSDLMPIYPYKRLAWLNELSRAKAEAAFLDCCGSTEWARRMAEDRPFVMIEQLFGAACRVWLSLSTADHLEAFAAHPKIGSTNAADAQKKTAAAWSRDEQSAVTKSTKKLLGQLADCNRLYEQRFGFIFIVFAAGKTADEMLAVCKARLGNSVETELQIAAEEQQKITELRLTKLLEL